MGEKKWYVLRTAGTKEKKAADYLQREIERSGLQDQVGQVIVPVKKEIVTKNGKRKVAEKLLFPGYVLIQAELSGELEYIIRNLVPGMSGFLTENRRIVTKADPHDMSKNPKTTTTTEKIPVPVRDEEIQRILGIQDENVDNPAETEVNYAVGDSVKITDGPFSGFNGVVSEIIEDRSRLKVEVSIFDRSTSLALSFSQVTKV